MNQLFLFSRLIRICKVHFEVYWCNDNLPSSFKNSSFQPLTKHVASCDVRSWINLVFFDGNCILLLELITLFERFLGPSKHHTKEQLLWTRSRTSQNCFKAISFSDLKYKIIEFQFLKISRVTKQVAGWKYTKMVWFLKLSPSSLGVYTGAIKIIPPILQEEKAKSHDLPQQRQIYFGLQNQMLTYHCNVRNNWQ